MLSSYTSQPLINTPSASWRVSECCGCVDARNGSTMGSAASAPVQLASCGDVRYMAAPFGACASITRYACVLLAPPAACCCSCAWRRAAVVDTIQRGWFGEKSLVLYWRSSATDRPSQYVRPPTSVTSTSSKRTDSTWLYSVAVLTV